MDIDYANKLLNLLGKIGAAFGLAGAMFLGFRYGFGIYPGAVDLIFVGFVFLAMFSLYTLSGVLLFILPGYMWRCPSEKILTDMAANDVDVKEVTKLEFNYFEYADVKQAVDARRSIFINLYVAYIIAGLGAVLPILAAILEWPDSIGGYLACILILSSAVVLYQKSKLELTLSDSRENFRAPWLNVFFKALMSVLVVFVISLAIAVVFVQRFADLWLPLLIVVIIIVAQVPAILSAIGGMAKAVGKDENRIGLFVAIAILPLVLMLFGTGAILADSLVCSLELVSESHEACQSNEE